MLMMYYPPPASFAASSMAFSLWLEGPEQAGLKG
jgi:hypothetical protein